MQEEGRESLPEGGEEQRTPAVDTGSATIRGERGNIHVLSIIGQIEGHQLAPGSSKTTKYEHILPLLTSLEESREVDGVLFLINTVGGDVEAGLAMAELIAGMKKPTVSLVLGGCHSIGVPLAVAAQMSMIVPSASMMIHPVRMSGTVIAAPQTYRYFQRLQESIVGFVCEHSAISRERFEQLMLRSDELAFDVGCVLYGKAAVEEGLIDRVGRLSDALDWLYHRIWQKKQQQEQGSSSGEKA